MTSHLPNPLPFPADLDGLLAVDPLSACELGIAYRLLRAAWTSASAVGPRLVQDPILNAGLARVSVDELLAAWPRLVHAFLLEADGNAWRPVHADRLWHQLAAQRVRVVAQRRAAGMASAVSRRGDPAGPPTAREGGKDPPGDQRVVNDSSTSRQRAVDGPFTASALPGTRARPGAGAKRFSAQDSDAIPERSSAAEAAGTRQQAAGVPRTPADAGCLVPGASGELLAGAIYARLEADAQEAIARWRRDQVLGLLTEAVAGWEKAGRITLPDGRQRRGDAGGIARVEAAKLANYPFVTPCAVAIALQRIRQRDFGPDAEPIVRPLSWLIGAVGAKSGGRPLEPALHEQGIVDAWAKREKAVFDAERVKAASMATARRIDGAIRERSGEVAKWHSGQVKGA